MPSAGLKLRAGTAGKAEVRISSPGISHLRERTESSDDAGLIRQAQAGRWEAFAELASHYDAAILALALRLTGSEREARELFQAAFVKAYRELRSYRFQCSFYLWLYRIVAGACIQFLQRRRVEPRSAHNSRFDASLHQLSPRERIVVELKHCFGLRLETIAAILETSEAVTRNTFTRAILILRLDCGE
jgi:RNA polymerase sigma-70 factor (ECF subfamily)